MKASPELYVVPVSDSNGFVAKWHRDLLNWKPPLDFANAVRFTAEWYRNFYAQPSAASALTSGQIGQYRQMLGSAQ